MTRLFAIDREQPSMHKKHFVKDYNSLIKGLREQHGSSYWSKKVMGHAVGGDFDAIGQVQADLLRMQGLEDGMSFLDVACGSGRTAHALSKNYSLHRYLGIDVVADMLEFARGVCPEDYQFELVDGLYVPADKASFDIACAFSLFTHLLHEETFLYLGEIHRVLKPGGVLVFSFLEFSMKHHWNVFESTALQTKNDTRPHLNVFLERNAIQAFATHLDFSVLCVLDASEGPYIPLSRSINYDNGTHLDKMAAMGQSVCVLRKRN